MTRSAETLRTAGALIARYGADVPAHQTRTARDIDATRARVMHTLYVTAHAITVALNTHGKDLVRESRNQGRPIPLSGIHTAYAVPPTVAWMQRAARCENLAHSYLAGRFVTAAHGEAARPADDHDRIPRALARWDIQAHRTLAHDPSPANLVLITRSQSLIAGASLALLDAVERGRTHDVDEAPRPRACTAGHHPRRCILEPPRLTLARPHPTLGPPRPSPRSGRSRGAGGLPRTHPRRHDPGEPGSHRDPSRSRARCRRQPGRARGRERTRPRGSSASRPQRPHRTGPRPLPPRTQ